jgi:hypothetical protein
MNLNYKEDINVNDAISNVRKKSIRKQKHTQAGRNMLYHTSLI